MTENKTNSTTPDPLASDSEFYESYSEHISHTYPAFLRKLGLNKVAIRAEGASITDSGGKTYIDCIGGYGLFNIGHNHPKIIQALTDQLKKKQQFTKPFITECQVRLAECLANITPEDLKCSFLCNSGSEAIDSAIKLARLYQGKSQVIAAKASFHGYTFGALSATGIPSFKRFFKPMVPDIVHIPFGDINAMAETITSDTAAVLLEPVQHEAGVFLTHKDYLSDVQHMCEKNGVIFILDEIKTGFGKTGQMFACDYFGIIPDILVLGKSMGGGIIPLGAIVGKKRYWKKFGLSFSMSASSFAGNILACTAALTTIQILQQSNLLNDCIKKGEILLDGIQQLIEKFPRIVKTVTGLGLLIGVTTTESHQALELSREMIMQGVLV
ncbi:MAG: aspartate aminotransferase family protein, partial [Candidatus Kariarchaeaceae archaeon]